MKKIFPAAFGVVALLTSCDKNAIQQTTQTIKNADSLYQNVSKGYKTVDSISKIWGKDSSRLPPEVREKTEAIRKNIDLKNLSVKNIDPVTAALKDLSKNVQGGTEIAKTIDSAADAIKNSDDPLVAITAVTGAINKISKKNIAKNQQPPQASAEQDSEDEIPDDPAFSEQPVTKTAELTMVVDDLESSQNKLRSLLKNYHADIVTEIRTDYEGTGHEDFTIKIPLKNFDAGLNDITQNLGNISEKSIATEGTDYRPEQMCDIKISLKQNPNLVGKDIGATDVNDSKPAENNGKFSSGFSKGLQGLAAVFAALLPFWPIFLIGGLVWYFIARNRRKKEERELQRQRHYNEEMRRKIAEQTAKTKAQQTRYEPVEEIKKSPEDPDDYSRFMPK